MNTAPIALFVYNRPEHTKKTVEALKKNSLASRSDIFIFPDGHRNNEDKPKVSAIRDYLHSIDGFKSINISKKEKNHGLADSIISGVSEITNSFGKVIVLEDDLVTSPFFLDYMNKALAYYEHEEKVMHISGYFYSIKNHLPTTFFYNQASCWGWATWSRAWKQFNDNAKQLYEQIKKQGRMKEFNLDNTNKNLEQQLLDNISGKRKTWAIKWHASIFLKNGLCLHPNQSLVHNIGFDKSGETAQAKDIYDTKPVNHIITLAKIELKEYRKARNIVKKFYKKSRPNFIRRIKNKINLVLRNNHLYY